MTTRRGFLKGAAVIAAGTVPLAATKPPADPRDLETVRAGELLCRGVVAVSLNGRDVDPGSGYAFNVAEGWVDVRDDEATRRRGYLVLVRHYGKIGYTMREPRG